MTSTLNLPEIEETHILLEESMTCFRLCVAFSEPVTGCLPRNCHSSHTRYKRHWVGVIVLGIIMPLNCLATVWSLQRLSGHTAIRSPDTKKPARKPVSLVWLFGFTSSAYCFDHCLWCTKREPDPVAIYATTQKPDRNCMTGIYHGLWCRR